MDNPRLRDGGREWSPAPGLVVAGWLGTAVAGAAFLALTATGSAPAGLLLAGVVTAGLALATASGTLARPRLRVDARGITIRSPWGARHHPWACVHDIRVLQRRGLGVPNALLQIEVVLPDGRERRHVLGRRDLGAEPGTVAAALRGWAED